MAERSIFSPALSIIRSTAKLGIESNASAVADDPRQTIEKNACNIGYHLGLPTTHGPIARRHPDGTISLHPNTAPPQSPFDSVSFEEVRRRNEEAKKKLASRANVDSLPDMFKSLTTTPATSVGQLPSAARTLPMIRSLFDPSTGSSSLKMGSADFVQHGKRIMEDMMMKATEAGSSSSLAVRSMSSTDSYPAHSQPSLHEMIRRNTRRDVANKVAENPRQSPFPSVNIREFNLGMMRGPGSSSESPLVLGRPGRAGVAVGNKVVVGIVEGRGEARGEVGIAAIDLNRPLITLCQISDSCNYSRVTSALSIMNPVEVILPVSVVNREGRDRKLIEQIAQELPGVVFTSVPRSLFDVSRGKRDLRRLSIPECLAVLSMCEDKYYCVAAAAAILSYAEANLNRHYEGQSLKISFQTCGGSVVIDSKTARNLEILIPSGGTGNENKSSMLHGSLLSVMQYTKTKAGARMLRANLLQPPSDISISEHRLNCVEELSSNEDFFRGLQAVLSRWVDLDSVISICAVREKGDCAGKQDILGIENRINAIVKLKQALYMISSLKQELSAGKNEVFVNLAQRLQDPRIDEIAEHVRKVIRDNVRVQSGSVAALNQRVHAVKSNVNGFLDVSVATYQEVISGMERYVNDLAEKENLRMELCNNASRGFHIRVLGKRGGPTEAAAAVAGAGIRAKGVSRDSLPACLIRVKSVGTNWSCTTEEMVHMDQKAKQAIISAELFVGAVVKELISRIRGSVGCLYELSDIVAEVDFLLSLAHYRILNSNCTRPRFSTSVTAVKGARHPVLEKLQPGSVVDNDFDFYSGQNFMVLTGPNMSGKTTFLKELALLYVMAHVGSFVPATSAVFRPTDRILSRMGLSDSVENDASTAKTELTDFHFILQSVTDSSLVLLDELGRSTSPVEGPPLCWALLEPIVRSKAFTVLATHSLFLTRLANVHLNVFLMKMDASLVTDVADRPDFPVELKVSHRLKPGIVEIKNYGILSAADVLPSEVVKAAVSLSGSLNGQLDEDSGEDPWAKPGQREIRIKHDFCCDVKRLLDLRKVFGWSLTEYKERFEELRSRTAEELELLREQQEDQSAATDEHQSSL